MPEVSWLPPAFRGVGGVWVCVWRGVTTALHLFTGLPSFYSSWLHSPQVSVFLRVLSRKRSLSWKLELSTVLSWNRCCFSAPHCSIAALSYFCWGSKLKLRCPHELLQCTAAYTARFVAPTDASASKWALQSRDIMHQLMFVCFLDSNAVWGPFDINFCQSGAVCVCGSLFQPDLTHRLEGECEWKEFEMRDFRISDLRDFSWCIQTLEIGGAKTFGLQIWIAPIWN